MFIKNYLARVSEYNDFNHKRNGDKSSNFKCPVCGKGTYKKMVLNYRKETARCFGVCNKEYTLLELYKTLNNCSIEEAYRNLSNMFNLDIKTKDEVLKDFIENCYIELTKPENSEVTEYLQSRKVRMSTIREIKIGVIKKRLNRELSKLDLDYLGIPPWLNSDAIVFPIHYKGDLKSFILHYYTNEKDIKYYKPKGTSYQIINKNKEDVYVVEGIYDYLSLLQEGFNCYCLFGHTINKNFISDFKDIKDLNIMLDGDKEGRVATRKLLEKYVDATIIELPDGDDPNSLYIKKDSNDFIKYLKTNKIKHLNSSSKYSKADEDRKLINFIQLIESEIELYYDELKEGFVKFRYNELVKFCPIKSSLFMNFITIKYQDYFNDYIGDTTVKKLVANLSAKANFSGSKVKLKNRTSWYKDKICIDLSRDDGKFIIIAKDGWKIEDEFIPLFTTESHQLPQVIPCRRDNAINEFFEIFPNLTSNQQILLLTLICVAFIPDIPKPIISVWGSRGSSKTTLLRALKRIIDRSKIQNLKQPTSEKEMVSQLYHHYFAVFDNLDGVKPWMIRCMTTAATGEGDERRKLYSDDETVIYTYTRMVATTAINRIGLSYPDYNQRLISINLKSIDMDNRKTAVEIKNKIDELIPFVLGEIFTLISKAMMIKEDLNLDGQLHRMSDYQLWSTAIIKAYGLDIETFNEAYSENLKELRIDFLEYNPVVSAINHLIDSDESFEGSATELLDRLEDIAIDLGFDTKHSSFPKSASSLSRRLNSLEDVLLEYDIIYEKGKYKGSNSFRYVKLYQNEGQSND